MDRRQVCIADESPFVIRTMTDPHDEPKRRGVWRSIWNSDLPLESWMRFSRAQLRDIAGQYRIARGRNQLDTAKNIVNAEKRFTIRIRVENPD